MNSARFSILEPGETYNTEKDFGITTRMYRTCRLLLTLIHRTFLLAAVLIGGTFAFRAIENHYRHEQDHLSIKESAYFCYTILTITGLRDKEYVTSDWGKIFTIAYALTAIPLMLFTLGAYGMFLNHCIRKSIMGCEFCCCKCWKGEQMHLKVLIILLILFLAEMFCLPLYVQWLTKDNYLDSVFIWVNIMTTVGHVGLPTPYPIEESLLESLGFFGVHFFCLITLAGMYQAVQGMIESINNNTRGICAKIFCCYSNDNKDDYELKESHGNANKYSEYVHE